MKGIKKGQIKFTFYIMLMLFFIFYVLFLSIRDPVISKIVNIFIFVIAIIIFSGGIISFYYKFLKVKHILKIKKEKEKNIRDFYRYQKFLEPTDFSINN